ncbi:MAG: spore maturation protein [Archangiaceae bacterium]|nr:spore maturation protein [Archangiaceae bacterium]
MNWIFLVLVAGSVLVAAWSGNLHSVTTVSMESAKDAATLALSLIGPMALWLGFFGILKEAGALRSIANLVKPVMTRLFPDVPPEHPAMGAMVMNIAANMLGLGNAATPFGLKAMGELNKLNARPGVATNAMVLFLAINNSGVALLQLGVVAMRSIAGSRDPAGILVPSFLGALIHTSVAIVAVKLLQRRTVFAAEKYAIDPSAAPKEQDAAKLAEAEAVARAIAPAGGPRLATVVAIALAFFGALALHAHRRLNSDAPAKLTLENGQAWAPRDADRPLLAGARLETLPSGHATIAEVADARVRLTLDEPTATEVRLPRPTLFLVMRSVLSDWILPGLMLLIATIGFSRRVRVYDAFITAAKEGFDVAKTIIPYLIAVLVPVAMFRASGALDAIMAVLGPVVAKVGFPVEALPMALIRPLSGSAALGVMTDSLRKYGPDSFIGYLVSMLNGSSETTFYVLSLYFGAIGVKAIRHTLIACLLTDAAGVIIATAMCHLFFG